MHNKIETELEINIRYIESRFEGCADAVSAEFWWVMKAGNVCCLYGFHV